MALELFNRVGMDAMGQGIRRFDVNRGNFVALRANQ
jgi:hypothetical protein